LGELQDIKPKSVLILFETL